jgi:hypothetical protein
VWSYLRCINVGVRSRQVSFRQRWSEALKLKINWHFNWFYVLFTVHLGIILVNDHLDAQFFFLLCLFQSSTCFEQPRAHHQKNQLYQSNFWYMSLCVGGRSFPTCTLDGHLQRVTYTRSCTDTIDSSEDEHEVARNM